MNIPNFCSRMLIEHSNFKTEFFYYRGTSMCSRKPLYFEAMFLDPDVGRREHIQCHKKVIPAALMGSILMIKFRNPMQPPQITKPSSKLFHAQKHRLPWNQSLTWLPTHRQIHLLLHPPLPTLNFQLSIRFPALTLTFLLLTFTAPPSHFSTLFSFPFNLFSLTLHFSSHTFFAPLQYFSACSHSPFQLSLHSSHLSL